MCDLMIEKLKKIFAKRIWLMSAPAGEQYYAIWRLNSLVYPNFSLKCKQTKWKKNLSRITIVNLEAIFESKVILGLNSMVYKNSPFLKIRSLWA